MSGWMDDAIPAEDSKPTAKSGSWMDGAIPVGNSQGDYWGDVGKNFSKGIHEDAPEVAKSIFNQGKQILPGLLPGAGAKTATDLMQGGSLADTPYGQTAQGIYGAGKQGLGAVWQGVKDTAKIPYAGIEMLGGTPMSQTSMGQTFRERPISMPLGVAGTVAPLLSGARLASGAAREAFAGAEPNFLERMGGRGVNNSLGIQPDTTEAMTPKGGNPGKVGTNLGLNLHDEGLSGMDPVEAKDVISQKRNIYGNDVKQRVADIKAQNRRFGEWPEIENPLKQDANTILKPLIDKSNELSQSYDAVDKFAGSHYRGVYDELANTANQNGGFLTLDDIRGQMQKIGSKLGQTNPTNDRFPVLRKIYGELAQIQDNMVSDVANSSARPELKQGLLDANANYSRMARIEPDVFHASGKAGVGKSSALSGDVKNSIFKSIEPTVSKYAIKAGRGLRAGSIAADEATALPGKAIGSIFNKGKQLAGNEQGSIFPDPEESIKKSQFLNMLNEYSKPGVKEAFQKKIVGSVIKTSPNSYFVNHDLLRINPELEQLLKGRKSYRSNLGGVSGYQYTVEDIPTRKKLETMFKTKQAERWDPPGTDPNPGFIRRAMSQ